MTGYSIITSTIGRANGIAVLLRCAAALDPPPEAVVVADQSDDDRVRDVCAEWAGRMPRGTRVLHVRSPVKGHSRGRNDALAVTDSDIILNPDDDCTIDSDGVAAVLSQFADSSVGAVCGVVISEGSAGSRIKAPRLNGYLGRKTIWRTLEAATAFRKTDLLSAGAWDPYIGVGAGTPWGSGEGSDLLVRMIDRGSKVVYDKRYVVQECLLEGGARAAGPSSESRLRSYARGTGYVYSLREYTSFSKMKIVLAPLARGLWRLGRFDVLGARRHCQVAVGRVEGLLRSPHPNLFRPRS